MVSAATSVSSHELVLSYREGRLRIGSESINECFERKKKNNRSETRHVDVLSSRRGWISGQSDQATTAYIQGVRPALMLILSSTCS